MFVYADHLICSIVQPIVMVCVILKNELSRSLISSPSKSSSSIRNLSAFWDQNAPLCVYCLLVW